VALALQSRGYVRIAEGAMRLAAAYDLNRICLPIIFAANSAARAALNLLVDRTRGFWGRVASRRDGFGFACS
jgi:hypothetical protein